MSGVQVLSVVKHVLTLSGAVVQQLQGGAQGPAGPFVPGAAAAKQVLFVNATANGTDTDTGYTYDKVTGVLTLGGKTVTASAPVVQASQTWNNVAAAFTAMQVNVTDTASAAGSLLLDLQVGGVSKASVDKSGKGKFTSLDITGLSISNDANGFRFTDAATAGIPLWLRKSAAIFDSTTPVAWGTPAAASFDLALFRGGPGILEQRNGLSAQTFRLYNSFTDTANYERASIGFSGNQLNIISEAAGTGTPRLILIQSGTGLYLNADQYYFRNKTGSPLFHFDATGNLIPDIASVDLGASWAPIHSGYFGTSVEAPRIKTNALTVGTLAAAATAGAGAHCFVTDSSVAASGNFGAVIAGGGANIVPVYSDGTSWRIG